MEIEKKISEQKRLHRDIFRKYKIKSSDWADLGLALLASSVVGSWLDLFFGSDLVIAAVIFGVTAAVKRMRNDDTGGEIHPYAPTHEFMGLYCIGEIGSRKELVSLNNEKGLIIKDKESKYIVGRVEKVFRSNHVKIMDRKQKKGLCLVGKSGSGKSTLLSMVKLELKEKGYLVRDFSSVYMNGGTGISTGATAGGKNKVAIFDQFERLFQEGVENQKNVFALIRKLSENGVVVLFSMREEALLPFLEVVDLNHLEHAGDSYACCRVGVQNCNKMAHGDHTKKASGRGNIIMIGSGRIKGEESAIRERCNDVFKEEGDGIYRIVKNHPVIEQQIMLNMRQNGDVPFEAKEAFARGDLTDVMKWYYDVQLCSTGDYFNASRIMYLMSMMRQKNEAFGTDMIMDALCVPLGYGEKHEEEMREYRSEEDKLKTCLEALAGMSLLRVKNTGSNRYYEVSHDYIAESFEVYANTELPSDVKAALDDYRSGHERRRKMDSLGRSRNQEQFQKARKKDGWVFAVWMIAFLCTAIYYCMGMAAAVYSEIPLPFGTTPLPLPVLILADFSMFYIFSLYRNVAYYYGTAFPQNRNAGDGVRIGMVHLLYLVTMIFGVCTVLAGEHWLVFLGVGNIMNALTWLFIASDGRISSYGRKQYRLYGWKTVAVGVLLILFSQFLMLGNFREIRLGIIDIGEIGTVMQLIAMGALLLYGYVTHMNREFFYANLEPILNM